MKNPKSKSLEDAEKEFRNAFDILCLGDDSIPMEDMMEYLNLSDKTIYRRVNMMKKEFSLEKKRICRRKPPEPLQINALEPEQKNSSNLV